MKQKVIVIGLPKTGTSSLAAMLRMLGFKVTGPETEYQFQDYNYLDQQFARHDGFQDYPWCFEWQRYKGDSNVKYIILNRSFGSWFTSFYESYGGIHDNYLAYSYMNIDKQLDHKDQFEAFYKSYYERAQNFANQYPEHVLTTTMKSISWGELCLFLNRPIPRNIFGKTSRIPHVRKNEKEARGTTSYRNRVRLRNLIMPILGRKNWNVFVGFLRRNNLIR